MPAGRTLVAAVCAVAAAGATLTGCNGDDDTGSAPIEATAAPLSTKAEPFADLTAAQLLSEAELDMRNAGALTYQITGTDSGSPAHVKATASLTGACVVSMDLDGGKTEFIIPGGRTSYLKGDKDFWVQNTDAHAAKLFAGKWVKVPASELGGKDLSDMCDLDDLMESLTSDDHDEGTTFTRDPAVEQNGRRVVPIVQTSADGAVVDLYISTGATPYVVKYVAHGDDPEVGTFADFGKQPDVSEPPGAVDPKDLAPGHPLGL